MFTNLTTSSLRVFGMMCGHCEQVVAAAIRPLPGVSRVSVDSAAGVAVIGSHPAIDPVRVADAIYAAGFDTEWPS